MYTSFHYLPGHLKGSISQVTDSVYNNKTYTTILNVLNITIYCCASPHPNPQVGLPFPLSHAPVIVKKLLRVITLHNPTQMVEMETVSAVVRQQDIVFSECGSRMWISW